MFLAFFVDYYLVSCVFSWFCVFIVVLWVLVSFVFFFIGFRVLCVLIGFVCFLKKFVCFKWVLNVFSEFCCFQ